MPRRVSLPGADELFRTTGTAIAPVRRTPAISAPSIPVVGAPPTARDPLHEAAERGAALRAVPDHGDSHHNDYSNHDDRYAPDSFSGRSFERPPAHEVRVRPTTSGRQGRQPAAGRGTGRTRHEEKITVYVSSQELVNLEHARLILRADYGVAVDRGRIVREAIALLLQDFEVNNDRSLLVRRLTNS